MQIFNPFVFGDNDYKKEAEKSLIEDSLKESGILKSKKILYLIIDKKDYDKSLNIKVSDNEKDLTRGVYGYGFLVNLSISEASKTFTNLIKTPNSSVINMNIHTFDVMFPHGVLNPQVAIFTYRNAYTSEIINRYDHSRGLREEEISELGIDAGKVGSEIIDYSESLKTMGGLEFPSIVPAQYYNSYHMWKTTGDWYTLSESPMSLANIYIGSDLIDPFTVIEYMDIKKWDILTSTHFSIRNDILFDNPIGFDRKQYVDYGDAEKSIIRSLFQNTTFATSMFNNTILEYDTQLGINISSPGSIPFLSDRNKLNVVTELQNSIDSLKDIAHEIENVSGPIRMFYSPSLIGDKMKIIYKDNTHNQDHTYGIDRDYTARSVAIDSYSDFESELIHGSKYSQQIEMRG